MNVDEDDNEPSGKRKNTNIYDESFSNPFDNNVHEPLEQITPLDVANIIRKKKTLAKKTLAKKTLAKKKYSNEDTPFSNEFYRKDDNYFIRSNKTSPKNLIISKITKSQNHKITKS